MSSVQNSTSCFSGRFCAIVSAGLVVLCLIGLARVGMAQIVVRDVNREYGEEQNWIILPYVFRSETFDTSVGVFGVISKYPQEQSTIYATAFGSANGSWRALAGAYDLRLPGFDRLFFSPTFMFTDYSNVKAYIDGNPDFPIERAGTHGSDPENHVTDPAWDGSGRLSFRYVLPWGHGKNHVINRVKVKEGLRISDPVGGQSWNPLNSGRTYILVEPFYRKQEIELDEEIRKLRSNGVKFELRHDNTDFILNPSKGSKKSVGVTRDWGFFRSSDEWTHLELEYGKFFGLNDTNIHRQRLVALNVWVSDVPTWEVQKTAGISTVRHRPPYFEGSTLGGFYRMRAYPVNRFSDRSAVYYSAEYRATPWWNPLEGVSLLGSPEIQWWQWILFCEIGRVAEDFDLDALHSDMNWDTGFGLRLFSEGLVGRLDLAVADEGWSILAMVGHPF